MRSRPRMVHGDALVVSLILCALILLTLATPAAAQKAAAAFVPPPQGWVPVRTLGGHLEMAVDRRLVVMFRPGVTDAQQQALHFTNGAKVTYKSPVSGWQVLELTAGQSIEAARTRYLQSNLIVYADADFRAYPVYTPNDPFYASDQYAPQIVQADLAWDTTQGTDQTVIAIVDTGVYMTHPEFTGRIWTNPGEIPDNQTDDDGNGFVDDVNGWDFVDGDNDPSPVATDASADHGTHCAGIAAATGDNGEGIAGMDWNCKIMPVRVLQGTWTAVANGIDYATQNGANVISMSIGGYFNTVTQPAINAAHAAGVTVVCAAGNEYTEMLENDQWTWRSPVCNDGPTLGVDNYVLGVVATDSGDMKASFSNYGNAYNFIDVCAPGVNIYSCSWPPYSGLTYDFMSGTSMSCPQVAGLCGLIYSQFPTFTPDEMVNWVAATCENIDSLNPGLEGKLGAGRINAAVAVGLDPAPAAVTGVAFGDTPGEEAPSITGFWRLSADDGRGFNDVTNYIIRRGQTDDPSTFTTIATLDAGTTSYVDTNVQEWVDYYYTVVTRDAGGNEVESAVSGPALSRDDVAPDEVTGVRAKDRPGDEQGGAAIVTWRQYTPPHDFYRYRVYRASQEFTNVGDEGVIMVAEVNDEDQKSFTDETVTNGDQYWYAVTCVDDGPSFNEKRGVEAAGPVVPTPNFLYEFSGGTSIIAFGVDPTSSDAAEVLGLVPEEVMLYTWDTPNEQYLNYAQNRTNPLLAIDPGKGFFFNQLATRIYDIAAMPTITPPDTTYTVDLQRGWNLLGNPFNEDILLTDCRILSGGEELDLTESNLRRITRDFVWGYDPVYRSYTLLSAGIPGAGTVIPRGHGFFLWAFEACQLQFQLPANGAAARAAQDCIKQARQWRPTKDDWLVRLVAESEKASDRDNFIGVSSRRSAQQISSPPPGPGDVELYFGEDRAQGGRLAAQVYEHDTGSLQWEFTVECPTPNTTVNLSWPDLSRMPKQLRPVLRDRETGRSVYMRTAGAYAYDTGNNPADRHFVLQASPAAGHLAVTGLSVTPTRAGQEIAYSLSQPATVDLEIRNIAGLPVRTIINAKAQEAGRNVVVWDGRNAAGARVPAGRYLVKLTAANESGARVSSVRPLEVRR